MIVNEISTNSPAFVLITCTSKRDKFDRFQNQEVVVISLQELQVDQIPHEIGYLTNTIDLTIQLEKSKEGWAVYPPLSWYEERELKEPFLQLPETISNLNKLKSLQLSNMDIHQLPKSISKLKNLEFLDLSMNKLDLSKELPKLLALPNLKRLRVQGNHYDEDDMEKFKKRNPNIHIIYKAEDH